MKVLDINMLENIDTNIYHVEKNSKFIIFKNNNFKITLGKNAKIMRIEYNKKNIIKDITFYRNGLPDEEAVYINFKRESLISRWNNGFVKDFITENMVIKQNNLGQIDYFCYKIPETNTRVHQEFNNGCLITEYKENRNLLNGHYMTKLGNILIDRKYYIDDRIDGNTFEKNFYGLIKSNYCFGDLQFRVIYNSEYIREKKFYYDNNIEGLNLYFNTETLFSKGKQLIKIDNQQFNLENFNRGSKIKIEL